MKLGGVDAVVKDATSAVDGNAPRFDFAANRALAEDTAVRSERPWYDSAQYRVTPFALRRPAPDLIAKGYDEALAQLAATTAVARREALAGVNAGKTSGSSDRATALRALAACLTRPDDQRRAMLHAHALEHGYDISTLAELAGADGAMTVVAGQIESWFGKSARRLPTSFAAARRGDLAGTVAAAMGLQDDMSAALRDLHAGLRMAPLPEFSATDLLMMAGEGDTHPKHIAYFLPSDQGVARSPFKRTYYFNNVHMALVDGAALPLSRAHLDLGRPWPKRQDPVLAMLGVLAHEAGHSLTRSGGSFTALNRHDRWLSVTMQELAADVFGVMLLAEVIGPALGQDPAAAIAYHLGECLRYVDRGLGCFADSDGMYFQLSYLAQFGVLEPVAGCARWRSDPEALLAGFRSLARMLADTVLAGDVAATCALAETYGPAAADSLLQPFLAARSAYLPISLAYEDSALNTSPAPRPYTTAMPQADDALFRFYCVPRLDGASGNMRTLYEIWEDGHAYNDSVTPSTYCADYRAHLIGAIAGRIMSGGRLFSIGCGNAFVERDLIGLGYRVDGIDWNEEAVRLARAKGVDAVVGDFLAMPAASLAGYDGIYADGLIGHLYDPETGVAPFLAGLRRGRPKPGTWLVFSNDAPLDPFKSAEPHPRVENFWLISRDLLADALMAEGYDVIDSNYFEYDRPMSGPRNRTICLARVGG